MKKETKAARQISPVSLYSDFARGKRPRQSLPIDILRRMDNAFIRWILFQDVKIDEALDASHLQKAKGIVSQFDVFLETTRMGNASGILEREFGDSFGFPRQPERKNSHVYPQKPPAYEEMKAFFLSQNAMDVELYNFMRLLAASRQQV